MAKFKVMMTDNVFPDLNIEQDAFGQAGIEFFLASDATPETLAKEGKDCDAILNVFAKVTDQVIHSLEKCKVIVRTGIGYNTIDLDVANQKGIMVANVPDYCQGEVADHAFSLFLAVARKICFLNGKVKSGVWNANEAGPIPRLQGKTFGLYGFGSIAKLVATRARAFGMNVMAFDPYQSDDIFLENDVKKAASLESLFFSSDFISIHAPLTKETKYSVNSDLLKVLKKSAIIINTARGELIDTAALIDCLEKGTIAGAGLDVLEQEPPQYPSRLMELQNTVITPHAAYFSEEAMPALRRMSSAEIIRTLLEGQPKNWVNRNMMKK